MGVGNRGFVANKCKYQNCYTTNQRKKLLQKHTRIDAVVVHGWDDSLAKLANTKVSISMGRNQNSCKACNIFMERIYFIFSEFS